MKTPHFPTSLFFALFFLTGNNTLAQISVPFLTIAPDARAAGMGDVGAASEPDVNSLYWNVAKYAFVAGKGGLAATYTPWLKNLVPGIYLANLSGYYKINKKNILSSSIRYFELGEINFVGQPGGYHPFEMAVDVGYSRWFSEKLSGGIALRYIHSDLLGSSSTPGGDEAKPGTSIAGDLGVYYQNSFLMKEREAQWALGLNLSNVGTPVSYSDDAEGTPIPTNLRIGGRFQYHINSQHSISLMTDINKLLVPTPPVYDTDTVTGEAFIVRGKAAPESVLAGMFQSFYDAPGIQKNDGSYSVFREEMYEIMYSVGMEYRFNKLLAIRTGYFHQHSSKGNRQFLTLGAGAKYHTFSLDLSYLMPSNGQNSELANTFRVMFSIEFGTS